MDRKWRLSHTKQCSNCPFRKDCDPYSIPNYTLENHLKLLENCNFDDISVEEQLAQMGNGIKIMSCHYHSESYCIGWIHNQLKNNIPLRMHLLDCENALDIAIEGEQHENFIDTLPKDYVQEN